MSEPRSTLPIWVNILLVLLILDIGFRIIGWLQVYFYPEYGVPTDYVEAWIAGDVVLTLLALGVIVAIGMRAPVAIRLGVVTLAIWTGELFVRTSLGEFEGSEFALMIGLDIAIATLNMVLIERLLRSRSVREAFGTVVQDGSPHFDQPPPPPTFDS